MTNLKIMKNDRSILLKKLYDAHALVSNSNPVYVEGAAQFVSGDGNPYAKIVFIGEAPGQEEERSGRPFQGRSGKLLRHHLAEHGFDRKNIFVTNVVKFRPPNNRKPTLSEIEKNRDLVASELAVLDPAIIVPVGSTALSFFFPRQVIKMSNQRGKTMNFQDKIIFPLFHPAYILRNYSLLSIFIKDIENLSLLYSAHGVE